MLLTNTDCVLAYINSVNSEWTDSGIFSLSVSKHVWVDSTHGFKNSGICSLICQCVHQSDS